MITFSDRERKIRFNILKAWFRGHTIDQAGWDILVALLDERSDHMMWSAITSEDILDVVNYHRGKAAGFTECVSFIKNLFNQAGTVGDTEETSTKTAEE